MPKRIVFTGGGSGGPVVPLVAVLEELKSYKDTYEIHWVGTQTGPERLLLKNYDVKEFIILPATKLDRFFSLRNFVMPLVLLISFFKMLKYLTTLQPDAIISAGGFVSVPVVWAGWLLRIPSLIHQQDVVPGLANKLMVPCATKITVSFKEHLKIFPSSKTVVTGNPVRKEIADCKSQIANLEKKYFNLEDNIPAVLVVGGGQGSEQINMLISKSINDLVKFCQVIHITGQVTSNEQRATSHSRYHPYRLLTDRMVDALAVADVVVSRAGFSTLTELSVLGKPSIIIPMPNSHQEKNAQFFADKKAVKLLPFKSDITDKEIDIFKDEIKNLLENPTEQKELSENIKPLTPPDAAKRITDELLNML